MKCVIPILFLAFFGCGQAAQESQPTGESDRAAITELLIENIFRDSLGLAEDVEIVVSYLEVPPNSTLPTHWHPGEEYVYVLDGSGELTLQDESTTQLSKGDFFKVPMKAIHSFTTKEKSATAIVFRVHEEGQPDRILVE